MPDSLVCKRKTKTVRLGNGSSDTRIKKTQGPDKHRTRLTNMPGSLANTPDLSVYKISAQQTRQQKTNVRHKQINRLHPIADRPDETEVRNSRIRGACGSLYGRTAQQK